VKFPVPVLHGRRPLSVLLLGLLLAACASQAASESKVSESDGALMVETKITGFALSARSASAGPVTFNVANSDDMPHDFALSGNGVEYTTKRLQPGESESFTLELAAGTYTYLCTMEGHGIMMTGSLTVN
jgi:plastocyanin